MDASRCPRGCERRKWRLQPKKLYEPAKYKTVKDRSAMEVDHKLV